MGRPEKKDAAPFGPRTRYAGPRDQRHRKHAKERRTETFARLRRRLRRLWRQPPQIPFEAARIALIYVWAAIALWCLYR